MVKRNEAAAVMRNDDDEYLWLKEQYGFHRKFAKAAETSCRRYGGTEWEYPECGRHRQRCW